MNSQTDLSLPAGLRVALLSGGVGGAKLADGLAHLLPASQLTVIVNTGDDFQHCGLTICPDVDTVLYTLAGLANPETGWGRRDESWAALTEVAQLGGPDWFRLGDRDLATHLVRSHLLTEGWSLTAVVAHLARRMGVEATVLPMSDQPAPTRIVTPQGDLSFQTWFVRERWQPRVEQVLLPDEARAAPAAVRAVAEADLVIIAPSNPYVSVDPILNAYPLRATLTDEPGAVVAVSPIVGGEALKGPAAKMMREMGLTVSPRTVADHYVDLLDGFVYDRRDEGVFDGQETGPLLCTETWMKSRKDRRRLAQEVLAFGLALLGG